MRDVVSGCTPYPVFPRRLPSSSHSFARCDLHVCSQCPSTAHGSACRQGRGFGQNTLLRWFVWRENDVVSRFGSFPKWNERKWDWTKVPVHKIILNARWELTQSADWKQNSFHLSSPLPFLFFLVFYEEKGKRKTKRGMQGFFTIWEKNIKMRMYWEVVSVWGFFWK